MIGFVAEEELAILKADADGSKPMPIRVLEIMDPNGSKSSRARSPKLRGIALWGSTACRLPARVIDAGKQLTRSPEHKLGVLSAAAVNHNFATRFKTT
jgi:hypothetical protein